MLTVLTWGRTGIEKQLGWHSQGISGRCQTFLTLVLSVLSLAHALQEFVIFQNSRRFDSSRCWQRVECCLSLCVIISWPWCCARNMPTQAPVRSPMIWPVSFRSESITDMKLNKLVPKKHICSNPKAQVWICCRVWSQLVQKDVFSIHGKAYFILLETCFTSDMLSTGQIPGEEVLCLCVGARASANPHWEDSGVYGRAV